MRIPRLPPLTLRTQIFGSMGLMLLLLLGVAVGALSLLQSAVRAVDDIVEEANAELVFVTQLQAMIQNVSIVVHDNLIGGHDGHGADAQFQEVSRGVDLAFADADARPFALAEERRLLRSAEAEWQEGRLLREGLLTVQRPLGNPGIRVAIQDLHNHIERVLAHLQDVQTLARGEILERSAHAQAVRRQAWLVFSLVGALGLAAALLIGRAVTQSILQPLRELEVAADRLGAGDLSRRTVVRRGDELGKLGKAFNVMAEKLAQSWAVLETLTSQDSLTGLCNLHEFQRRFYQEAERSWRYGHPFSVLLLDIDHFKPVNDTFGHPAGNEVLRALAGLIRSTVRPADTVARYGGDEFAVILPETLGRGAETIAERIRARIASHPISIAPGHEITLGASIGVASFPEDTAGEGELVRLADQALYEAKRAGRNRVARWGGAAPAA